MYLVKRRPINANMDINKRPAVGWRVAMIKWKHPPAVSVTHVRRRMRNSEKPREIVMQVQSVMRFYLLN